MRILAILEKFDAKATFFIIGKHVNGREYILEKIVEKGHLIGNHSYEHDTLYSLQAASWIHADIQKNNDLLTDLIHQQIRWFRPPYGVTNPSIGKALQTLPIDVIGWNIRSLDTSISDPHQVLQRIIKRLKGEDILLLHDTMENTALILEALLLYCKENNIDIVPLSQLIDSTPYA